MGPHSKMASSLLQLAHHQLGPKLRHYGLAMGVPLNFPGYSAFYYYYLSQTFSNITSVRVPTWSHRNGQFPLERVYTGNWHECSHPSAPALSKFVLIRSLLYRCQKPSRAVCPSSDARRFPNFFPRSTSAAIMLPLRLSLPFFITI